ncbi:FBD-associated F-box protein At4g13985-like [Silene latifolia]|uniref:FBD-associated F-box protein At4g13985-like n=1 Tax=Silene latifolia TaxID=37657 RepID=UPI003D777BDD
MEENPSGMAVAVSRWTSLPDDILYNILDRLDPTKSIAISDTTFDIKLGYNLYQTPHHLFILDNLFTIFANLPLLNTFRLQLPHAICLKPWSRHIIGSWVRRLREHKLQHFEFTTHYSCSPYDGYRVDIPSVFRLNSLLSLDLNLCMDGFCWSIPNSIDLPNLNKLSLILVDYTNLGMLIRSCPSLRDLTFNIHKHREVKKDSISISSKKLKRLIVYLHGSSILELVIDAPKLEDLNFSSDCLFFDEIMFDSINHVKSLTLVRPSPLLDNYRTTTTKTTVFLNMTRLKLALGSFKRIEDLSSMLHCPNLEELVLDVTQIDWMVITQKPKVITLLEHLKRLELQMKTVRLDQDLLELAAYILRSVPVLEKLILYAKWSYSTKSLAKDQFCRSLFECPRSSPHCQIELLGAYGSQV